MNIFDKDDEKIEHIAKFISGIWQIHAFREENTRTTAIFTIQYLRSLGYEVNNEINVPSLSQVEELIISINKDYLSIGDIMNLFGLKNRTRFRKEYITPALAEGALEMKYPNTPRHPRQQYRMTEQAKTWKKGYEKKNK